MPTIIIRRGETIERTVALGESPLVLGRGSDSDLVLDHSSISRKHASVTLEAGGVIVRDFESRNGIYRGRERVAEWLAVPGEQLGIGIFQLEIVAAANLTAELDYTRVLSSSPASPVDPPAAPPTAAVVRVTEPNGSSRDLTIAGDSLTIGRAADASLRLNNRMVSRSHARILREGNRWKIFDAGSSNGFSVNGNPVKEADLSPGDEIVIEPFRLVFQPGAPIPSQKQVPRSAPRGGRKALRLAVAAGGALVACVFLFVAIREISGPDSNPGQGSRLPEPGGGSRDSLERSLPGTPPIPLLPVTPSPPPLAATPVTPLPAPPQPSPPAPAPVLVREEPTPFRDKQQVPRPPQPAKPSRDTGAERLGILEAAGKKAFKDKDCSEIARLHKRALSIDSSGRAWQVTSLAGLDAKCESARTAEQIHQDLAIAHEREVAGKRTEAMAAYRAVLSKSPGHQEAEARIKALERAEQEDRGKNALLEQDRAKVARLMEDATIYDGLGDYEKACSLWKEVLSLHPDTEARKKTEENLARCGGGAGR